MRHLMNNLKGGPEGKKQFLLRRVWLNRNKRKAAHIITEVELRHSEWTAPNDESDVRVDLDASVEIHDCTRSIILDFSCYGWLKTKDLEQQFTQNLKKMELLSSEIDRAYVALAAAIEGLRERRDGDDDV